MSPRNSSAAADKAADQVNETAEKVERLSQDAARKAESVASDSQHAMNAQFDRFSRSLEGMTAFGQDNLEAFVKSSEIAAKAAEGIGSELSAFSKKAFEDTLAAAQDCAQARSVTELFEKQTAFAQTAFEGWMHQATKMNEICVAAAKDISAPIGERLHSASDRMKSFTL
jgi:phasin family protein